MYGTRFRLSVGLSIVRNFLNSHTFILLIKYHKLECPVIPPRRAPHPINSPEGDGIICSAWINTSTDYAQ